jgi:hypothetical protein
MGLERRSKVLELQDKNYVACQHDDIGSTTAFPRKFILKN